MRRSARTLASVVRRAGRGALSRVVPLARVATARLRGLGRRALSRVVPLARVATARLRGLGRVPLAGFIALAGASLAVGMDAGSADPDPERPPTPQADGAGPVLSAAADKRRVAAWGGGKPRRGRDEYYRRTTRKRVPPKDASEFLPLYREAERVYRVNWRLIASIHRQETAFSKASTTYHGLNDYGCCAGPMQFNVTNGPPSTWQLYRGSYRDGRRPERYPHRTRKHPSIYDDFDAIMAAGALLEDSGAGLVLDSHGAWSAAYDYYGHDLYGITYASLVVARAVNWQRHDFCPNCEPDASLVARFDDAYGGAARRELLAAEEREKKHRKGRKGKRSDEAERRRRAGKRRALRRGRELDRRAKLPSTQGERRPAPSPPRRRRTTRPKASPPPTSTQPAAPAPTTTPAPSPADCNPVRKLLGCKPE